MWINKYMHNFGHYTKRLAFPDSSGLSLPCHPPPVSLFLTKRFREFERLILALALAQAMERAVRVAAVSFGDIEFLCSIYLVSRGVMKSCDLSTQVHFNNLNDGFVFCRPTSLSQAMTDCMNFFVSSTRKKVLRIPPHFFRIFCFSCKRVMPGCHLVVRHSGRLYRPNSCWGSGNGCFSCVCAVSRGIGAYTVCLDCFHSRYKKDDMLICG